MIKYFFRWLVRVLYGFRADNDAVLSAPGPVNGAGQFTPVPQPLTVVNGRFTVTNFLANGREFFRLKKP